MPNKYPHSLQTRLLRMKRGFGSFAMAFIILVIIFLSDFSLEIFTSNVELNKPNFQLTLASTIVMLEH